jgi:hypothetical protein
LILLHKTACKLLAESPPKMVITEIITSYKCDPSFHLLLSQILQAISYCNLQICAKINIYIFFDLSINSPM